MASSRAAQLEGERAALQGRVDALRSDLARMTQQQQQQQGPQDLGHLQQQLEEARAQAAAAGEAASRATREAGAVREAASQLASSKAVLQRTLVAQLQSLREQLEASSAHNQALEEALLRLQQKHAATHAEPQAA